MELEFDYTPTDSPGRSPTAIEVCRLQELAAAQQAFAGHELTNQLVPLQGFAQILLLTASDALDAESRDLLGRMADLTRQIDAVARRMAEIGRLLREPAFGPPVALAEVVREAVAEVRAAPVASDSVVGYHIQEGLPRACLSRRLLHQVFVELLRNATRAIPAQRQGRVEIEGKREGNLLEVTIRDNGRGYAGAQPERLFEPFAAGRQPGAAGPGLGLLFVRQCLALWQGRVVFRSRAEQGTEVVLTVPDCERSKGDPPSP